MEEQLAINGGKPVREEYLPYSRQWIDEDDIQAVVEVLRADYITTGPLVAEFERRFSEYAGSKYAVSFSSGTAALHAAVSAAGVGTGDEVITTPITFAASANCALYVGARPVFADIKPDTYNIDPKEIVRKITPKTKAIIPVHYAGQPADLDEIHEIADKCNLTVIEDGAHACGAKYKGKRIGALSHMTVFSFHPVKHITTGEGGMVTTDSEEFYKRLTTFRNHGITRNPKDFANTGEGPWHYEMQSLGYNYRITDIQCALGISQLKRIDELIERRRALVAVYDEAFSGMPEVITPHAESDREHAWHLYVIRLNLGALKPGTTRRMVFEALRAENIGVNVHYIPVYYHPYYQKLGYCRGLCPKAEEAYETMITLPLFPKMEPGDAEDVVKAVKKVIFHYK